MAYAFFRVDDIICKKVSLCIVCEKLIFQWNACLTVMKHRILLMTILNYDRRLLQIVKYMWDCGSRHVQFLSQQPKIHGNYNARTRTGSESFIAWHMATEGQHWPLLIPGWWWFPSAGVQLASRSQGSFLLNWFDFTNFQQKYAWFGSNGTLMRNKEMCQWLQELFSQWTLLISVQIITNNIVYIRGHIPHLNCILMCFCKAQNSPFFPKKKKKEGNMKSNQTLNINLFIEMCVILLNNILLEAFIVIFFPNKS